MTSHSPRRWPLLADKQDSDSLEARVAFHLHRLGLHTTALTRFGVVTDRNHAADIVQGRIPMNENDAGRMASLLGVAPEALTRRLTEQETKEWHFYRVSARHRREVWSRAKALWESHGLSLRQASLVMGLLHPRVVRALSGNRASVLAWTPAQHLTSHLGIKEGPVSLIEGLEVVQERD